MEFDFLSRAVTLAPGITFDEERTRYITGPEDRRGTDEKE
jgi:hypothetical protein